MGVPILLSEWLSSLRRRQIVDIVHSDPRTNDDRSLLLGVPKARIFSEVIEGGQADFAAPWEHLSPFERVLLYAFYNQKGHLEELTYAFELFLPATAPRPENPIVIDLGCGPYTGCLALASVLGRNAPFTYVGIDRASAMHDLGERLVLDAVQNEEMHDIERISAEHFHHISWFEPPRWRPVIIIVSYLMASPTLNVDDLATQLNRVLTRFGRGRVSLLYTNSIEPGRNRSFPTFRSRLESAGFVMRENGTESIIVDRYGGIKAQTFFYALFHRAEQTKLSL